MHDKLWHLEAVPAGVVEKLKKLKRCQATVSPFFEK